MSKLIKDQAAFDLLHKKVRQSKLSSIRGDNSRCQIRLFYVTDELRIEDITKLFAVAFGFRMTKNEKYIISKCSPTVLGCVQYYYDAIGCRVAVDEL